MSMLTIPDDDFTVLGIEGTARLLGNLFDDVARNLLRISRAVSWLDEQGCDVSAFEGRLGRGELRSIADGLLLPEVWLKLSKQKKLLRAVSALPRELQLKLVADKPAPVEVAERSADGETTVRKVAIENLPTELIAQVFDGTRLRTPAEQIAATIRPVDRPTLLTEVPDREALIGEIEGNLPDLKGTDRRAQRRAVAKIREAGERLMLLLQSPL